MTIDEKRLVNQEETIRKLVEENARRKAAYRCLEEENVRLKENIDPFLIAAAEMKMKLFQSLCLNATYREALENCDKLITDGWSVKARDMIRETLAKGEENIK